MKRIDESEHFRMETAALIWHYSNGFPKEIGDIRWALVDLYRTTSGEYRLHVSGGPGSNYANQKSISSVWGDGVIYSDGEAIIPMSQPDLMTWGEEYLPDGIYRTILKDIKKKAKQKNVDFPNILELSEQKLAMREKEIKNRLTVAKSNAEVQARQARFYEQFIEL